MTQNKITIHIKRTLTALLLAVVMLAGYTSVLSDSVAAETNTLADSSEIAQDNQTEENRKWSIPDLIGMLLIYVAGSTIWFAVLQLAGYYFIDVQTGLLGNIDGHQVQIDRHLERMRRNAYPDEDIDRH